jgi:GNAT superfamily N-acetyltransferase
MSKIRFAQTQDIPQLVEGGSRMHLLTRFRDLSFDPQKVAQAFADIIDQGQPKYGFFVAENSQGAIVGALIGVAEQHIFSDAIVASVMHYDVLPEARMGGYGLRLMRAFEQWAKNRQVVEINFGVNSVNNEEELIPLRSFALRLGYRKTGESYVRTF